MGRSAFELIGIGFFAIFLLFPLALLFFNLAIFQIPYSLIARNIFQASISAIFSILLGFPLAYILTKRSPLAKLLSALSLIPLVLPQPAMILSLVALFGANGLFDLPFSLYTLEGIILAHSLYNFPLAARIIGAKWLSNSSLVGASRTLGASPRQSFARITLPSLLPAILSSFAIVFAFSFTSFSIPLIFGGISNSTLEVEIFRSFFRDFNIQKGIFLAFLQMAIFIPVAFAWKSVPWHLSAIPRKKSRFAFLLSIPYLVIFLAVLFGPLLRLNFAPIPLTPIFNSLLLAFSSATLCILLWLAIGEKISKYSFLLLGVSPAVLAVSYYFQYVGLDISGMM
ncbi:MAG: ABC transporter permease subunit, partial [Candidatus Micrarchaeota archaeon]